MSHLWSLEHFDSLAWSRMLEPGLLPAALPDLPPGWRQWVTAGLDLLFPPLCLLCHSRLGEGRRDPLCGSCWERLPRLTSPYCACCGRPFYAFEPVGPSGSGAPGPTRAPVSSASLIETEQSSGRGVGLCEPCRRQPPPFAYARAAALYRDAVREALHAFKFGRKTALARPLADLLEEAGQDMLTGQAVDCLVPVPLHPAREAERGFNQALLLARRLSRRWGLPVAENMLRRVRATRGQTELSAAERRQNVRGAFVLRRADLLAGAHVLLIDDILTTGATAAECSRVLLEAGGARTVGVLTVARVP